MNILANKADVSLSSKCVHPATKASHSFVQKQQKRRNLHTSVWRTSSQSFLTRQHVRTIRSTRLQSLQVAEPAMQRDWKQDFRQRVFQPSFVEILLRGQIGPRCPWRQVSIRPVIIKKKPHLQFSYFDRTKNIVKNAKPGSEEAEARLTELLDMPFSQITLRSMEQDTVVQMREGRTSVHTSAPAKPSGPINLEHNKVKDLPIPPHVPHPFLQRIGLQTAEGKVRAGMQDKFTQVNEFLKLLKHTGLFENMPASPDQAAEGVAPGSSSSGYSNGSSRGSGDARENSLGSVGSRTERQASSAGASSSSSSRSDSSTSSSASSSSSALHILDCGCGSSHLTFGLWHYTRHVLGVQTQITGVDTNAALMARSNQYCKIGRVGGVGWLVLSCCDNCNIVELKAAPMTPINRYWGVDTNVQEYKFTGVNTSLLFDSFGACNHGAPVVMAVPCCHKHLHRQLSGSKGTLIPPFQPLMSQGIVRQRFLDLLTDTLRASILRIMGYKVDVIEFISTEHTPRNILIRATKSSSGQSSTKAAAVRKAAVTEYLGLRDFWTVVPYLETLIGDELALDA
ncbi:hypothetical protein DUNSADRAFT_7662 [Dunaliella salina]|uniref:Methyltransferase domain-containing protein n=1 Tax=Dunaliella salina TaxID=3046 RepID=A0ABQ7H661_DUNSA|nr:hypothetical protein DUNSADRAFT_7662 [Dunaliella salina]|eukprot:KAF5842348.1 hypothetical protein DUNSADRAFT_7662 [Dunaliella salina]